MSLNINLPDPNAIAGAVQSALNNAQQNGGAAGGATATGNAADPAAVTEPALQETIITTIRDRAVTLDFLVDARMEGMEGKNAEIADVNRFMQDIRANLPASDKQGESFQINAETWQYIEAQGWGKDFKAEQNGGTVKLTIEGGDKKVDGLLSNFRSKVDELSGNSQLEMIQLQGLINKRNQSYELLSTIMRQFTQSIDKAVNNIR